MILNLNQKIMNRVTMRKSDVGTSTTLTFLKKNFPSVTKDSLFSIYTSIYGVNPVDVTVIDASVAVGVTLTFDAIPEDMEVAVTVDG